MIALAFGQPHAVFEERLDQNDEIAPVLAPLARFGQG